jgi:hypothetical protein
MIIRKEVDGVSRSRFANIDLALEHALKNAQLRNAAKIGEVRLPCTSQI